jgi:hypothetical protein
MRRSEWNMRAYPGQRNCCCYVLLLLLLFAAAAVATTVDNATTASSTAGIRCAAPAQHQDRTALLRFLGWLTPTEYPLWAPRMRVEFRLYRLHLLLKQWCWVAAKLRGGRWRHHLLRLHHPLLPRPAGA